MSKAIMREKGSKKADVTFIRDWIEEAISGINREKLF